MPSPALNSSESMPEALLEALATQGRTRTFAARSILVNEGDLADSLYIILSGRLRAFATSPEGREVVLAALGPGEFFGELALDGGTRSASVQALETCVCRIIQGSELRQFMTEHPEFAVCLVSKLIRMVRRLTEQVKSLALQDVYGRIVRLLTELSEPAGEERLVRHKLTQQDVADRIGSSREMVSRVLKDLTVGGYVSLREGRYVIHRKFPPGR